MPSSEGKNTIEVQQILFVVHHRHTTRRSIAEYKRKLQPNLLLSFYQCFVRDVPFASCLRERGCRNFVIHHFFCKNYLCFLQFFA
mgnify:CR=1 FL=1